MAVTVSAAAAALTVAPAAMAAAPATTHAAAKAGICQAVSLRYAFGTKHGTNGQITQVVKLTDKGSSSCTMKGFPGVALVGAAHGRQDYTWPLVRQSARYSTVTLAPGRTAHFNLIYLTGVPGDGVNITVHKIVITPPGDRSHAVLGWNQSVLLQDAATYPGTYISPVISGS
jgi:hypothetical protein